MTRYRFHVAGFVVPYDPSDEALEWTYFELQWWKKALLGLILFGLGRLLYERRFASFVLVLAALWPVHAVLALALGHLQPRYVGMH